jgi:hypothetical protein
MPALLNQLLTTIGTYRVLEDHEVSIRAEGRHQRVPCPDPGCGCAANVVGQALVCTSLQCNWKAGHVVDYLAKAKGWSVPSTLARLQERYPDQLETLDGVPWGDNLPALIDEVEARRSLIQFFLDHRGPPDSPTIELARAAEHFANQDLDLRISRHTAFLLKKPECDELADLVGSVSGEEAEYKESVGALVLPFFTDFIHIGHIEVYALRPGLLPKDILRWSVFPARLTFSGLWEIRGGDIQVATVMKSPFVAAGMNLRAHRLARPKSHIGMCFRPQTKESAGMQFPRVSYLMADNEGLRDILPLKAITASGGLRVGYASDPETVLPWLEFLTQRFDRLLLDHNEAQVDRELESLQLTQEERTQWLQLLSRVEDEKLRTKLEACVGRARRIHHVRDAKIHELDTGYKVERPGRGAHPCTNYTFSFEHSVYFPDSMDLLFRGHVHFMGHAYPCLISREDMRRPTHLNRAAQHAVACRQGVAGATSLATPNMSDVGLAASLVLLLEQQVSLLPRVEGVKGLGWSRDRRRFDSPLWRVDDGNLIDRTTCADPQAMVLRNFSFSPPPETPFTAAPVSDLAGELLAFLVAQTARVQLGRPAPPLCFLNTKENRQLLREMFASVFQQTSVVTLSYNNRGGSREVELLSGHPCLAAGSLAEDYAARFPYPVFMLSDRGRVLEDTLSSSDLVFMAQGFALAVSWLAKTEGTAVAGLNTELYEQDLLEEGGSILEQALNYTWTGSPSETPVLDSLLVQRSPVSLGDMFREHFSEQRLIVRMANCSKDLRPRLAAELKQRDPTFLDGEFASMDLLCGRGLFKAYYKADVELPKIDSTLPSASQWAATPASVTA